MKKLVNVRLGGRVRSIVFDGDRVASIEEGALPAAPGDIDGKGLIAIPGLVDVHAHGCLGLDTMDADFAKMAVFRAKHGTTTWLPTSMTAYREDLERVCSATRDVPGARLPGIHLEGPHIAASRKGAQNADCIRMPDLEELRSLRPAAIRVTVAPELPGALEYVRGAAAMGVSVTLGHTDATFEQTCAAFDAGATCLTHAFNAMPGIHHRKPGPIGAAHAKGAYIELISDGFHVAPAVVYMMYKAFGPDRIVFISDSIRPAGGPEGEYDCGGLRVFLKNGEARLEDGTIAGSTATLWDCVCRAVSFGIPFEDAVKMATATPAAAAGLDAGTIAPGRPADVLLVDDSGAAPALRSVILRGETFDPPQD
ncbi:MAG: N-acetylglucosamine-6-phosphate deacetylase [Kiritimatiellae bacterium]|nr:N-acetylglucosamine-6-phosphate deacetylase [Kiritimatiellia bacterium]MBR1837372.1 N-acetylglucosamine-6-phosphate deacetylase [Kiritimatiellia bacterium]